MTVGKFPLWVALKSLAGRWLPALLIFGASVAVAEEPLLPRLDRLNTISRVSVKQGAAVVDFSRWNYSSEHDRLTLALEQAKTSAKYLGIALGKPATVKALGKTNINHLEPLLKTLRSKLDDALDVSKNLSSGKSSAKSRLKSVQKASATFSSAMSGTILKSYPPNYKFPVFILKTIGPPRHDIFYQGGEVVDVELTIENALLNCADFSFFPAYYSFGPAPITGFFEVDRTPGAVNTTIHYRTTTNNYPGSILFNVVACGGRMKSLPIYNRGHYQGEGGGGGGGSSAWDGNWSGTLYSSTPIGSGTNNLTFTVTLGSINEENGNFTGTIDAQGNFTGQILLGAGISSLPLTGKFNGNTCTISGSRTNVDCEIHATRN